MSREPKINRNYRPEDWIPAPGWKDYESWVRWLRFYGRPGKPAPLATSVHPRLVGGPRGGDHFIADPRSVQAGRLYVHVELVDLSVYASSSAAVGPRIPELAEYRLESVWARFMQRTYFWVTDNIKPGDNKTLTSAMERAIRGGYGGWIT